MSDATADEPVDLDRVRHEIEIEVRRRRLSGEVPVELERELDAVFARFAPPAVAEDLDEMLERAERDSVLDLDAPTASNVPGGSFLKRLLRRVLRWYADHVARQIAGLVATVLRAVRLLARRVSALEAASPATDDRVRVATRTAPTPAQDPWVDAVVAATADVPGRVVVAEAGAGTILRAVIARGVDAYGVEPRDDLAEPLLDGDLEVRRGGALDHLRRVPDGALGGVVLVGCVDRLPLGDLVELAEQAARAIGAHGVVVVAGSTPSAHRSAAGVVASDLAPGRPLHAETWQHLLASRGLSAAVTPVGESAGPLRELSGPDAAIHNENLARIAAAVFSPPGYVVVGTGVPAR